MLVLDPSGADWPDADFVTADTDEYIDYVFINERCLLLIDEAAESIGKAQSKDQQKRISLATRTRHKGHSAIFISQDATTINATIRRQCQQLWCFRQSKRSVTMLSEEFCNPGIMDALKLTRGECLHADLYGKITRFQLTFP